MKNGLCIWCGKHDPEAAPEHVFPASLGCPDDFCLTEGEVATTHVYLNKIAPQQVIETMRAREWSL